MAAHCWRWKPPILAALAGLPAVCFGAPLHVADAPGCDNSDGDPYYCQIQMAINNAIDGDTIEIAAGTYPERLVILRSVELLGIGAGQTIIDGGGSGRPVMISLGATAQLNNLTVQNGRAVGGGGGIFLDSGSTLSVIDCEVKDNVTTDGAGGGAISSGGILTIEGTRLTGNTADGAGGAVYVWNGATTILNSLLDHNQGSLGGALYSEAVVSIANSTVSDNVATVEGGALYKSDGTATFTNATVADNTSAGDVGGIYNGALATALQNSLVARNAGSGGERDCGVSGGATFFSLGHNYVGTATGCTIVGGAGDLLDQGGDGAKLAPLADNGGGTFTRALRPGSAAIDAGAGCGSGDQRGVARPIDGDGDGVASCDIGAFEAPEPDDDDGEDDGGDEDDGASDSGGGGACDGALFWLLVAGAGLRRRAGIGAPVASRW